MKWLEHYFKGWQRSMDYHGRSTRVEFWSFFTLNLLLLVMIGYGALLFGETFNIHHASAWAATLQTLFVIPCGVALLALGIRRMHDINRSGWWFSLVILLPLLELLVDPALKVMVSADSFATLEPISQVLLILLPLLGIGALCCQRSREAQPVAPWEHILQDI